MITVLSNPPTPPNSNFARGMIVWVTTTASQDPIDTDTDVNNLLSFCGTNGVNTIFLDIWNYLGGSNWSSTHVTRMATFLDGAHRSGIRVYALAGNIDWGTNQAWVMKNIVQPVLAYNALRTKPSEQFDGFFLDVEYWTDETNYPPSTNLPGLCDLVKAVRKTAALPVGLFSAFYLKDNTGTRSTITYNGKTAQDGEHMMDAADFVMVGTYRDHANDGGSESGPGQISLLQPWYDYASASARNFGLYAGSETTNVSPAYVTYYGATKASMETEHTTISNSFRVAGNATFLGQAVHSYDGWKAMT